MKFEKYRSVFFPLLLMASIVLGGLTGSLMGQSAIYLKPLGDLFLNLIFILIYPLVFFSVTVAILKLRHQAQLEKLVTSTIITFLFTSLLAALYMLMIVSFFPPAEGASLSFAWTGLHNTLAVSQLPKQTSHAGSFMYVISPAYMLPMIIFSILAGLIISVIDTKQAICQRFLQTGSDFFMRTASMLMMIAPLGFFAYFAVLIAQIGPQLMQHYLRIAILYYSSAFLYFFLAFTFFVYLAKKSEGAGLFWRNILLPAVTAFTTCSSAASIPANLEAAKKIGVPAPIYETVIPLGAILHKDGSVLGGMLKIAFLFGIFHQPFFGATIFLTAIGMSILVGMVMAAVPSGGLLGETLILSVYGFPPECLLLIAVISLIIDPLATLLNVTGDVAASMMIACAMRE